MYCYIDVKIIRLTVTTKQWHFGRIINMNITIVLSAILMVFSLIESIYGTNSGIINANKTVIDSNGLRFQRILHRKKRFLLFPPGAAIVVRIHIWFW